MGLIGTPGRAHHALVGGRRTVSPRHAECGARCLAAGHGPIGHTHGPTGRGRRRAQCVVAEFGRAQRVTIRTAAHDLPSPTFSPRQIDVMERILRNAVPEEEIDALLNSVGLEFNNLTDYIAERPRSPTLSRQQIDVMERIARGNFLPGQIEDLLRSAGLTKDQLRDYVINRPPTPRTPSPPRPRGRGRGRGQGGVPPGGGGGGDDDGGPPGGGGGGGDGGGRRGSGRGTPLDERA